jgi:hypothetical protein
MATEPRLLLTPEMPPDAVHSNERRQASRHKIQRLVYVVLDDANGGILRNLSEPGMAVQAVSPLEPGAPVRLSFNLSNPKVRVECTGTVAWGNSVGRAGIAFDEMPSRMRQGLDNWLIEHFGDNSEDRFAEPAVSPPVGGIEHHWMDAPDEAAGDVAAVPVEPPEDSPAAPTLEFSWWPTPIPALKFTRFVDGLAIAASVLLFYVVFLATSHEPLPLVPSLVVLLGGAVVFAGLYWLWFCAFDLGTPGAWMAGLANEAPSCDVGDERDGLRFR